MGRKTQGVSKEIDAIIQADKGFQRVLTALRPFDELPLPRVHKLWSFYTLAKIAYHRGVIVELGTWRAFGLVALSYGSLAGSEVQVFSVDNYNMKDWAGVEYTNADYEIAQKVLLSAGIEDDRIFRGDFIQIAERWKAPVSLLVWDGGNHNIFAEIMAWEHFVIPGGIIALHDTYANDLDSRSISLHLVDKHGYICDPEPMSGCVIILEKCQ